MTVERANAREKRDRLIAMLEMKGFQASRPLRDEVAVLRELNRVQSETRQRINEIEFVTKGLKSLGYWEEKVNDRVSKLVNRGFLCES